MKLFRCVAFCLLSVLWACNPQTASVSTEAIPDKEVEMEIATDAGKLLTVEVASENVRRKPNGVKLGAVRKGEQVTVIKRIGNWVKFKNQKFDQAYIWAPSVGYQYQNIYSPFFFFDSTKSRFRSIEYFRKMFSQRGQKRQETASSCEIFFKDTGLGSHEETILDVVNASEQIVEHGVTLYVNKDGDYVEKVRVDFLRPISGYNTVLKKSELPIKEPTSSDGGHVIWDAGVFLDNLIVDAEREKWESKRYSSVWFKLGGA